MESIGSQFDTHLEAGTGDKGIISDFYFWLQRLRPYQYKYVVAMTRRASNLVEAVRKTYPDALPNYITENGLLLLAEEIAKFYKENRCFPVIAILDDILVYGRNMNLLLGQFWSTICQCLSRLGIDVEAEDTEAAFFQCVNLWIYAVNEAPILLRHEFQLNMHSHAFLAEAQWRSLSDSIAKCVAAEDVASTSFVLSVKLPYNPKHYQPDPALWIADRELRYRNNQQQYTFYLFSPATKRGIYPSVRSYKKQGFLYFTPYFFMPELDWTQMICLLEAVFHISARKVPEATNECIRLFNRIKECSSRMTVYAQLATLLLSQITLSVFLEHLDPELMLVYDTDKIIRNFGFWEGLDSILQCFCTIKWTESQLIELLDSLQVSNVPDEVLDTSIANSISQAEIVNAVERLTYKQAVDHERDVAGKLQRDLADIPADPLVNRTGEQELSQFLARVKEQTSNSTDTKSMLSILSCLTQMMDLGDISLKARFRRHNGIPIFYSSLRTTEMSLAIMPRKLSVYYRQFYLLARLYYQDQDFTDRVEHYFRDVIFSGDPDNTHTVMISNARYFAQLIAENQMIAGSMLNWRFLQEWEHD